MALGPYCPVNKLQLKSAVRVHEVLFNRQRPSIQYSPNGNLMTYKQFEGAKKIDRIATNWNDVNKLTEIIIKDIEKCVELNPDYYVSIVGQDDHGSALSMHVLHSPPLASSSMCAVPLVDAKDFTNDVY